ncbi:tetratricopeptide repeat protein [Vaginella massiliensis]|uniref:tetratricopeptide repeat protein n=1 Tax=Vaginella massiliensis TaxID=1816680 RepID=UPI00375229A1
MKKFVLSLGLVLAMGVSFAQELTTEPSKLAEKHYNEAKRLLSIGEASKAATELAALGKYENGKVYIIRNKDTKKEEYYYSEEELNKAIANGNYAKPKTQELTQKFGILLNSEVSALANKVLDEANTALDKKDYKTAAPKFLDIYNLTKALGATDELYKYQAAITYYNAKDFTNSLKIIKELAAANFTGMSQTQTKDYNRDLYVLALNNLYTSKTFDPILEEALKKYPNDSDISTLATAIYQVTGNGDKMKKQLEESIKINPNDQASLYNLGTLYLQDNEVDKAKEAFKKSLALNPNHLESNVNMALTILNNEKEYVEKINNNLGNSKNQRAIYDEYTKKRKDAYTEALPYLQKAYELDKKNVQYVRYLINAYRATENQTKEDEFRALEKSLIGK